MKKRTTLNLLFLATVTPLILTGCQSTIATTPSEPNPHYIAMASTIAQFREIPCQTPATASEQARLAQFDPMVIVGGALHAWVPPHEFPVFLQAIQDTLHCDSQQWVAQFQQHLAHSKDLPAL